MRREIVFFVFFRHSLLSFFDSALARFLDAHLFLLSPLKKNETQAVALNAEAPAPVEPAAEFSSPARKVAIFVGEYGGLGGKNLLGGKRERERERGGRDKILLFTSLKKLRRPLGKKKIRSTQSRPPSRTSPA